MLNSLETANEATIPRFDRETSDKKNDVSMYLGSRFTHQNFVLIWLDSNITHSDDNYHNLITLSRQIINTIDTFADADQCVDFLTEILHEKVFMIVSDVFAQQLVPLIHHIPQLYSIYIFSDDKAKHNVFTNQWTKVKGIFTKIQSICDSLKHNTKQCDHDLLPVSVIPPSHGTKRELNELEPLFMYSLILKEILLDIKYDEHAMQELAHWLRQLHFDNHSQLRKIEEFKRDYRSHSAISWYTREWLIYSMLNRALRTMDAETVIKMGFFLCNLHRQIEQLNIQQLDNRVLRTVYRGQGVPHSEFEKLRNSKDGLLSFNNFLSTSINQEVAHVFANSSRQDSLLTGILFQINIDPTVKSTPFATLHNVSNFVEEAEVLFSMHTVFRICQIERIDDRFWQVELELTRDDDQELKQLTEYMREEIRGPTGWHRLGQLLIKTGNFDQADRVLQILLGKTSNDDGKELSYLYHQLGYIKLSKGDYKEALMFSQKTLEIRQKSLPSNHPDLAIIYNNIAVVYYTIGEYSKALVFYQKALEIEEKSFPPNHPSLATTYSNIGLVHDNMGKYSKALEFYQKALEIEHKFLPPNHPDLATIYNNIATVHYNMGQYSKALVFYQKTLKIQEKSLPLNHPHLTRSYKNIAGVHQTMGEFSKALEFFQKMLEIEEKYLHPNHPSLATTYNNIGGVHKNIGEYSKALEFYQKTLEIRQKSLPPNHPSLATIYNNIAGVHYTIGQYSQALEFFQKTLQIEEKSLVPNHPSLAVTYNNIGLVYGNIKEYSKALEFNQKALEIRQESLPPNHPSLATTYNNIGLVHSNIKEYSKALEFYRKTLEIQQESLPANHPNLATTYNNIAGVHYDMREYSKALDFYQKALELQQKSLPANHLSLATTYNNIAAAHNNLEQYSKALSFFERTLEILQHSLPENHSHIQSCQKNLAEIRQKL